ncbi:MAG: InlB B-repeat-containing protein, partial [Clostridia bacterium]|nr:InlB B-repeat-containing protein [Clostridia bacterium]
MLIQNYANLTLNNMTLDATQGTNNVGYVLSTNNGETTINDTTITAKTGGVAFDVYSFGSYTGNKVTLTGDSVITGDVEIGSSNVPDGGLTLNLDSGKLNGTLKNANIAEGTVVNGTKTNAEFSQGAPEGYVWQDQNDGTSKLVKQYTVKFVDADGTTALAEAQQVAEGDVAEKPADPAKTGYEFDTWKLGEANYDFTTPITENITLVATWKAKVYTITYDLDGGALAEGQSNPTTYTIESDAITLTNPTKAGYDFAGWTGTDLSAVAPSVTIAKGITGDRSYTATWTAKKYTVQFVNDDNNNTVLQTGEVAFGDTPTYDFNNKGVPTKPADGYTYTFAGWTPAVAAITEVPTDGKITYKATYTKEENTFTIKFMNEDGTGLYDAITAKYDTTITPPTVTKPGYVFSKWVCVEDATKTVPAKMPAENLTFRAEWTNDTWTALAATPGATVEGNTFKYSALTLDYSQVDTSIGRNWPAAWVGINVFAPATINAGNIDSVKYDRTGNATLNGQFFGTDDRTGSSFSNNKDGEDPYYIGVWVPLSRESVEKALEQGVTKIYRSYSFYTKEDKSDSQTFTVEIDITNLVLNKDAATDPEIKVVDGVIVDKNENYNVTLKLDGGAWTATQGEAWTDAEGGKATSVRYNHTATKPADPTKVGFKFLGWFNGEEAFDFATPITAAIELTAKWDREAYTITYNGLEDATVAPANKTEYNVDTEDFTLTNPTKVGYTFKGWSGTDLTGDENTVVSITKGSTGDREYTANWTANTYTVEFVKNNESATGTMANMTFIYGKEKALTANAFQLANNNFVGWATAPDGNMVYSDKADVKRLNLNDAEEGKFTLYAVWTEMDKITVTYKANYTADPAVADKTASFFVGVPQPLDKDAFTREGYTLTGWNTRDNGRGTYYDPDEVVELEKNLTLYAEWTVNQYTVTFKDAGANGAVLSTAQYDYGTKAADIVKPAGPTKEATAEKTFTFNGWTPAIEDVTVDATYTATYTEADRTYTVTFDSQGGAPAPAAQTVTYEGRASKPADPTKEGFAFAGWELGDVAYDFNTPVTGDITLTAKWAEAVASITRAGNTTYYTTLEDAFANAEDGDTIEVLKNCTGNGIKVPQGKFAQGLTVDFNGYTYTVDGTTVGSTGTETQGFQLLKDNKITFKDGTITGSSNNTPTLIFLIQNYSDLTLEGMNLSLEGKYYKQYTLSNNNGAIVIDGSTINAPDYSWANLKPSDVNSFAFDVCRYSSYPSVSVTVTGDSVINGDVEVSASNSDPKSGMNLMLESGKLNGDIVLDKSAQTIIDSGSEKAAVTEKNTFNHEPAEGYGWKDNGDDTSTLAKLFTVTFKSDDEVFATQEKFSGEKATEPETDPTKDGYEFDTWKLGEADYDFTTPITGNITLVASWKAKVYTITYDLDGGALAEGQSNPTTYTIESDAITLNNPTKAGYTFAGWTGTDLAAATMEVIIAKDSIGDREYKATWTAKDIIVSFDADGGAFTAQSGLTVDTTDKTKATMTGKTGSSIRLPKASREGSTFLGWTYGDDVLAAGYAFELTATDEPVTMKAAYEKNTYYVFYSLNGGEASGLANGAVYQKAEFGTEITLPEPTWTGHTFKGWKLDNNKTYATKPNKEGADTDWIFTVPADSVMLLAQWEVTKYTIKFVDEDGTELQSSEVAEGETPAYEGEEPTKAATAQHSYKFKGWTPEIVAVTADATYTATYTETVNKYTIKFVNADGTELQSSEVAYDETPAYTGETP